MGISKVVTIKCDHGRCKNIFRRVEKTKTELIKKARANGWLVKDSTGEFYCPFHRRVYDGRFQSKYPPTPINEDNIIDVEADKWFSRHGYKS